MSFGKMAGLTGLQAGLGMLGGLLDDSDEQNDPNARLKYFEGGGEFVDPKSNLNRANRAKSLMLRGIAGRGPVTGLRGESSPLPGMDHSALLAMLDEMLGRQ